jgi:hypothetical protein
LTFEALERVLTECCGAVFVAGPDNASTIRGRSVKTPGANIMLEFGLMAGVMSRHNVAIWRYGHAELPSDLQGLTIASPDPPEGGDPLQASTHADEILVNWSRHITATVERIARTEIVHGYTGRWTFSVELGTWRGLVLQQGSYAFVKGYFDLTIPPDGQTGRGSAHGTLSFKIRQSDSEIFEGDYLTAHEVIAVLCLQDGSLRMTTEAFALQKLRSSGDPPPALADLAFRPEPWTAQWTLSPAIEPRKLKGDLESEGSIVSKGRVELTKPL